jgi:hypothetical protein
MLDNPLRANDRSDDSQDSYDNRHSPADDVFGADVHGCALAANVKDFIRRAPRASIEFGTFAGWRSTTDKIQLN